MRFIAILILMALLMLLPLEPVLALGMGGTGPCVARNALEAYCVNQGGCPKEGNCIFPDGSYCELRSFYNGTCPGRAYYEQAIWMAEAYNFLNGGYITPYMPDYVPYNAYPNAYQTYQNNNPYWYQNNNNNYYYWPTYAPGYDTWRT
jgi:hypothetical protein